MKNKFEIPIGDKKIVMEGYEFDPQYPIECTIYLCDKNNVIIQDICLVREHYEYDPELKRDSGLVDCLVWTDDQNEDYTHKFVIPVHEEE